MTKKTNKQGAKAAPSIASAEVTIVIDKVLYDLLKAGETSHVLTWKEIKDRPAVIAVTSAQDDEPLLLKVKHMDTVGFGYLPKGYPARFQATRKTTRLHVLPIEDETEAAPADGETETE